MSFFEKVTKDEVRCVRTQCGVIVQILAAIGVRESILTGIISIKKLRLSFLAALPLINVVGYCKVHTHSRSFEVRESLQECIVQLFYDAYCGIHSECCCL